MYAIKYYGQFILFDVYCYNKCPNNKNFNNIEYVKSCQLISNISLINLKKIVSQFN